MIRTNRANYECAGARGKPALLFTKWPRCSSRPATCSVTNCIISSRNSADRVLMLFRRVDVDEEPFSVTQMGEFGEADPSRRNPRVEQLDLKFIRREHPS